MASNDPNVLSLITILGKAQLGIKVVNINKKCLISNYEYNMPSLGK